jgi:transcriptional regulator with XRE-family HTH domain
MEKEKEITMQPLKKIETKEPESVAQQLKFARKSKNLTQEAVRDLSGYSQHYLSKIENGLQVPSIEAVQALCGVYDCQIIISKK